ncbi:hypothetical protein [Jannaschia sp. R86511]|uniref:hypothetical protein n=1 Tax=Jannaschia sp. R86511 TaxID=3093853 RepID=UPI0036D33F1F
MGTPSDWVSGERVFAPPTGTLDVDWLVPAVVEAVPGCAPAQARAALLEAWKRAQAVRASPPPVTSPATSPEPASPEPASPEPASPEPASPEPAGSDSPGPAPTAPVPAGPLQQTADRVVAEALRTFRA